ncbi:DEAD/DEAH box helicase [Neptuniibacter caesariensis]|uniref:ATP-dependent RNA helicase, DEAD box family protein n=1 Tax=Neptuniibacter caesariensis TaxID=207954 RepID=A0A7U8C8J7_NEPCE|nr:DEAD/DEAH box helicase [Neptuniibacter caesariensis]EAR62060.1 ATP-dependent RNA helicase, DEAD box family protein [Oceanospirillum sp. MED92] [Neptuniibacter caesariensis]
MNFAALDLHPAIQSALDECGYSEMTPIQRQAIVPARRGRDILANAQTGTGKTAAFSLPVLQQLADKPKELESGQVRALILTPTRELAQQLFDTIGRYNQHLGLRMVAVYGGVNLDTQMKKLRRGADLLIATPGRMLEHINACNVNLGTTEFVVLDEADRMLDMGFVTDVMSILDVTPKSRQTLLFSATLSDSVHKLSNKILTRPEKIKAARHNTIADTIEHVVYPVEEQRKADLFAELIKEENWFQVLVFTSTKAQANELMMDLKYDGIEAVLCHGDKSQGARRRAVADFKAGKIQVLVATEVAARGLDIQGLEQVVNYNLPYLAEDYVHRVGRAGRAGMAGKAISFVSREEEQALASIEKLIGSQIRRVFRKGYEVGSRDGLRKRIHKKGPKRRINKATRTQTIAKKAAKPKKR